MGYVPVEQGRGFRAPFRVGFGLLLIRAHLRHLRLSPLSFFSPNCLPWAIRLRIADCGLPSPQLTATFFIFLRQIDYGGLGTARRL